MPFPALIVLGSMEGDDMKVPAMAIGAAALAFAMAMQGAWAGEPLAPGKPAGVHAAQAEDDTTLFIIGAAAVVAGGIAIAASGNSDGGTTPQTSTATTTTTTTTTR
jgi:hypothetical protein